MEFCTPHWDALRTAIKDRGLEVLVAESGPEVVGKMKRQLTDKTVTVDSFDPLMGAHNAIVTNALQLTGIAVLQQDGCPLCWMTEEHKKYCKDPTCIRENFDDWITFAADGQVEVWKGLQT